LLGLGIAACTLLALLGRLNQSVFKDVDRWLELLGASKMDRALPRWFYASSLLIVPLLISGFFLYSTESIGGYLIAQVFPAGGLSAGPTVWIKGWAIGWVSLACLIIGVAIRPGRRHATS
jgi:hypothetical protein